MAPQLPKFIFVLMCISAAAIAATTQPARFASEIAAYEAADLKSPPPKDPVLFVGSSTFRMWGHQLEEDFTPLLALNRGFGGSTTDDLLFYTDRIVIKYRPKIIVVYCGENDIAAGSSPQHVVDNMRAFVQRVRKELGDIPIFYISMKPSPSRWKMWDQMRHANAQMLAFAKQTPNFHYIDTTLVMLDSAGQPRPDLFQKDMLHMNRKGQQLWIPIVREALARL